MWTRIARSALILIAAAAVCVSLVYVAVTTPWTWIDDGREAPEPGLVTVIIRGEQSHGLAWVTSPQPLEPGNLEQVNLRLTLSAERPEEAEVIFGGTFAQELRTCTGKDVRWDREPVAWSELEPDEREVLLRQVQFGSQSGWINDWVGRAELADGIAAEFLETTRFVRVRPAAAEPEERSILSMNEERVPLQSSRRSSFTCSFGSHAFWRDIPQGREFIFPAVTLNASTTTPVGYLYVDRRFTIRSQGWVLVSSVGVDADQSDPEFAQFVNWWRYYDIDSGDGLQLPRYSAVFESEGARSETESRLLAYGAAAALLCSVLVTLVVVFSGLRPFDGSGGSTAVGGSR